jgi:methionyl-tRNA synthetase
MPKALALPLPETIFAHGWWTVNGEKMSKSRGNMVDPHAIIDEFGADAFRYFLLREVPFGQDGDFSREALIGRINSELANDLGNLLSRTLTLIERFAEGKIPQPTGAGSHSEEEDVKKIAIGLFDAVEDALNAIQFHRALSEIWKHVDRTNRYLEQMAPWHLAKKQSEKDKLNTVLYTAAEALRVIALYLAPFMPKTAEAIYQQLGLHRIPSKALEAEVGDDEWGRLLHGTSIRKEQPLFPRVETISPQEELRATSPPAAGPALIALEDFKKLDLRVGVVLAAEHVPKSSKLLKLHVDLGAEQRQIVAGIGTKYAPDDLVGKQVVIVANLKPVKLMGIESQGMVLAAGEEEVVSLLTTLEDVAPGSKIK